MHYLSSGTTESCVRCVFVCVCLCACACVCVHVCTHVSVHVHEGILGLFDLMKCVSVVFFKFV